MEIGERVGIDWGRLRVRARVSSRNRMRGRVRASDRIKVRVRVGG